MMPFTYKLFAASLPRSVSIGARLTHLGKGFVMRKLVLVAALVLMAGGAQAVTFNVIGGQLHGASNVLVGGSLYDVQFLDGTCIGLYSSCDDVSDFTFQTEASAVLASQALLDQVFFDFYPDETYGIGPVNYGIALTPYALLIVCCDPTGDPYPAEPLFAGAVNFHPISGFPDQVAAPLADDPQLGPSFGSGDYVYAVWSSVPEPSTALLLGLGLTGLAAKGRRRS